MSDHEDPGSNWNRVVRTAWNQRASSWNEASERNRTAPDRQADLLRTMQALALTSGSRLLDAGCGSGQFSIAFAAEGCDVTGIDLSPAMIDLAREHAEQAQLTVNFAVGDLAHLPDRFTNYDAIHARVCLHFPEDIPTVLQEFRRVLKPGGRLFASVPGVLSPIYKNSWERHLPANRPCGVNYVTPWELETLLRSLGWQILDGWGEYGTNSSGDLNPHGDVDLGALPIRLQQAAATSWTLIAS